MKCGVCGQYSAVTLCATCRHKTMFSLLNSGNALDTLDSLMTLAGLDINERAAAASNAHRANLTSWAMVCAEESDRTPEIDRRLSSPSGQAVLIAKRLSDSTPEWAADCAREITDTYQAVSAQLVV